jgi:hypothetical protein
MPGTVETLCGAAAAMGFEAQPEVPNANDSKRNDAIRV